MIRQDPRRHEGESRFEAAGPVADARRRRLRRQQSDAPRVSNLPKSRSLSADNAAASVVFGHYDQNIARIERSLGVSAYANGNQVVIKGPRRPASRRAGCSKCFTNG